MHVRIEPNVLIKLQTVGILNRGAEFSGFGWCRIEGKEIVVYDFIVLDLGSEVFTEIPPEVILPLLDRPDRDNMKVWGHAHPVGNGVPGPHNWSGTDNHTCTKEPMGSTPEAVRWSVAIVRTPGGWVGRIDNHISKKVQHLEVFPKLDEVYKEVAHVRDQKTLRRREKYIHDVSDLFDLNDLRNLGLSRRELEDWIADEYGIDILDIDEYIDGDWEEEDAFQPSLFSGGKQWTTPATKTYSGRKM